MSDLNEIAKALASAQAEMTNPGFDALNPHFRNKFASLAAVRNAVVPALAKHGISMCQDLITTDNGIACTTILTHASGQQMRFGPLVLPATKADAQGFGSAGTYARRYSLMAVAGVVGDEDDDANAATGKPAGPQAYAKAHTPIPDEATEVPDDIAEGIANRMHSSLHEGDLTEEIRALKVLDLHIALNRDQTTYMAGSQRLAAKDRAAFKAYVAQGKEQARKPMNASGRAA